jgi:hypothetical protein
MDIKSAFLNGPIKEVYVEHPPGFEDQEYPNHVYKLNKAFYVLKQAPKAWYECLRDFLISMNVLGIFLLKMVLGLVRRILLSSLGKQTKIYLCAKYMLMISFLVLLINPFVMSLARS